MKKHLSPRQQHVQPIGGEFGVSCVIPTLREVWQVMEKKLTLTRGYTRFIMHPYVQELLAVLLAAQKQSARFAVAVTSRQAGEYLLQEYSPVNTCTLMGNEYIGIMSTDSEEEFNTIFRDMRNTGFLLNPHTAKDLLERIHKQRQDQNASASTYFDVLVPPEHHQSKARIEQVQEALSRLEQGSMPERTLLFNSGMSALASVVLSDQVRAGKHHAIMVGYPYVDTRELLEKSAQRYFHSTVDFLPVDAPIEQYIRPDTGLVVIEFPTNPLLRCADLDHIITLAHAHNAVVLMDCTIATPYNLSPLLLGADIVMHSTTKFLNGMNNHIGGVLFFHPDLPESVVQSVETFRNRLNLVMCSQERSTLEHNIQGFPQRMETINQQAREIAGWLDQHEAVEQVYHPSLPHHQDYAMASKYLTKGESGVISFVLKNSSYAVAEKFYDHCTLPGKGPSLGGEESLLCPITLLTLFDQDDAALQALHQDRFTMRLSVGTEPLADLKAHLKAGFAPLNI